MAFSSPFYRWRPHPWHGLEPGPDAPNSVQAYIEITPFDLVKYEVDKATGYLRVDRPQRYSSQTPTLYGFIPQTLCGPRVSALSPKASRGDGDPMDICVVSERPINRAEVILRAKVVGGIQLVDGDEADDKIIAVLANDNFWSKAENISDLPEALVARLEHYFSTYKNMYRHKPVVTIESIYAADHARRVISASMEDYDEEYGRG
ncbi:MAG: inorganic pyrophosphatase [Pirellulaceae bacterium]